MAMGGVPGSPVEVGALRTGWLDWEDEAGQDPGRYAGISGPSLVTVLDTVQRWSWAHSPVMVGRRAGWFRGSGNTAAALRGCRST